MGSMKEARGTAGLSLSPLGSVLASKKKKTTRVGGAARKVVVLAFSRPRMARRSSQQGRLVER